MKVFCIFLNILRFLLLVVLVSSAIPVLYAFAEGLDLNPLLLVAGGTAIYLGIVSGLVQLFYGGK